MAVTLTELVARFGGELLGDGSVTIRQVAPLGQAQDDEIGFVSQARYLAQLAGTRAAAVILPADARDATTLPRILTPNPYLYFARVSALLNPPPRIPRRRWLRMRRSLPTPALAQVRSSEAVRASAHGRWSAPTASSAIRHVSVRIVCCTPTLPCITAAKWGTVPSCIRGA